MTKFFNVVINAVVEANSDEYADEVALHILGQLDRGTRLLNSSVKVTDDPP